MPLGAVGEFGGDSGTTITGERTENCRSRGGGDGDVDDGERISVQTSASSGAMCCCKGYGPALAALARVWVYRIAI